jgi:SulP family sulfate permease|tara:strand:+ start:21072 stop:22007 length:936 start_codon:yes stop_codon:yes gene_type:complete
LVLNIKKVHHSIPGALVAVVAGTVVVQFGGLESDNVSIVKEIPTGLPSFSIPDLGTENLEALIPIGLTLALIAFMESISIAKAIQATHKGEYELDNNQEMIGLGMGNLVGSFFGCYPTTGGFSRSAVSDQAGAKTNLAAIIAAGLIAITLLFLTPLFYYLPKAILGSIIMVAVFGLIDFKYPVFLWKTKKQDFWMLLVSFVVTLTFGVKEGITAGVSISLIMLIYRTTQPHIAVLGRLKGTNDFRNVGRFEEIDVRDDVLVLRHDAQLYFANVTHFIDAVKKEVELKGAPLKVFVLTVEVFLVLTQRLYKH